MRPIVIVIENPDGEPTTYTVGDVELVELSSYPATGYAAEDRRAGSYDGYSDKLRSLAERVASTRPPGSPPANWCHARRVLSPRTEVGDE